eukprot:CAMPEP_0175121258 /NCGR_PEP_ID=MMETSP0087-20121206/1070_1 /TAXON_ID=136419 /ORGANISM="Unknown Unknown, Strain D1" /LENGTH=1057 /DNA_ID=CAMNT_0016402783 /DNA_START=17 /DNA_END=3190 /DNA_ORIENTATION=+
MSKRAWHIQILKMWAISPAIQARKVCASLQDGDFHWYTDNGRLESDTDSKEFSWTSSSSSSSSSGVVSDLFVQRPPDETKQQDQKLSFWYSNDDSSDSCELLLGTVHLNKIGIKTYSVICADGGAMAQAMILWTPVIHRSEFNEVEIKKTKWHYTKKKKTMLKKSMADTAFISSFLQTLFDPGHQETQHVGGGLEADNYDAKDESELEQKLHKILSLAIDEQGRTVLLQTICVRDKPLRMAEQKFQTLVEICQTMLREANACGDYMCCKVIFDLSYLYYCRHRFATEFLYSSLSSHEVYKSESFWETVFLDICRSQQALLKPSDSSDHQQQSQEESLMIRDLLFFSANHQACAGMPDRRMQYCMQQVFDMYQLPADIVSSAMEYCEELCSMRHQGVDHRTARVAWNRQRSTAKEGKEGGEELQELAKLKGEVLYKRMFHVDHLMIGQSGRLDLTNYRLYFVPDDARLHQPGISDADVFMEIPLGCINRYERSSCVLRIFCKDLRSFEFQFGQYTGRAGSAMLEEFVLELKKHAFPGDVSRTFAFHFMQPVLQEHNGWYFYNEEVEFSRQMSRGEQPCTLKNSKNWKLVKINKDYTWSPTYPAHFVIPKIFNEGEKLDKVKGFRSKGRIPALTYHHTNGKCILRCAQPLTGIANKHVSEDSELLRKAKISVIYDARPRKNAIANKAKGGGYEDTTKYHCANLVFCNIENIHVMRESLTKLWLCQQLAEGNDEELYSQLSDSKWLRHVRLVLQGANSIANDISAREEVKGVLVHCSDGWDRTAQLCALSQVLLDPFFRTRRGFAVLVDKDWVSFGHKFEQRCGQASKDYTDHERSPIFVQFLDCVWQLLMQNRSAFEFNEKFLAYICVHLYSNQFGNFLHNSERDRERAQVKAKTVSIWSLATTQEEFKNSFYTHTDEVIFARTELRDLKVWPFYYRWDPDSLPQEDVIVRARGLLEWEKRQHDLRLRALEIQLSQQQAVNVEKKEKSTSNQLPPAPTAIPPAPTAIPPNPPAPANPPDVPTPWTDFGSAEEVPVDISRVSTISNLPLGMDLDDSDIDG